MSYFGTDGIRRKNDFFTAEFLRCYADAISLLPSAKTVAVARDNRPSGVFIEKCLIERLTSIGLDVVSFGVIPSPCLALCTLKAGCDYGIMISASHNLPCYNGLKLFLSDGSKAGELEEAVIENFLSHPFYIPERRGSLSFADGFGIYREFLSGAPELRGIRIFLDCACGAASGFAPHIFRMLGADAVCGDDPRSGDAINVGCGAEHISRLLKFSEDFDICFAFDGDADRVKAIIKRDIYDGDGIMYCLARSLKSQGKLPNSAVCGTVMTNSGYENAYKEQEITLLRADVGDRSVYREMKERGVVLGGEKSGHVILSDILKTGDGIRTAIEFAFLAINGLTEPVSETPTLSAVMDVNSEERERFVEVTGKGMFFSEDGIRAVVRASGTEPIIRLTVEAPEARKAEEKMSFLKKAVAEIIK